MINFVTADFLDYLKDSSFDYLMIDPPWNYGMEGSKLQTATEKATDYSYWSKDNRFEVERVLDLCAEGQVKAVALWTTIPMLKFVMSAVDDHCYYDFRSLITWIKKYPSGKDASVMAHYFQNSTEFLVIIKAKKPKSPIERTKIKTHWEAVRRERTIKPKDLESKLIDSWKGKWAYIFCGPSVVEIETDNELDAVDIVDFNS